MLGSKYFGPSALNADPHQAQPVLQAGAPLDQARLAVVLLHGRGASAEDILGLGAELDLPDIAFLAPQAAGFAWYPERFMVETRLNEPYLTSALKKIDSVLAFLEKAGFLAERTALLGFSQGACLALEYAARNARRYAGVIGLSGGLIGADSEPRQDAGRLNGTPVFLGCSDADPHIPQARVEHAAQVLKRLGGIMSMRLYPNMGHSVNQDELDFVRTLLRAAG